MIKDLPHLSELHKTYYARYPADEAKPVALISQFDDMVDQLFDDISSAAAHRVRHHPSASPEDIIETASRIRIALQRGLYLVGNPRLGHGGHFHAYVAAPIFQSQYSPSTRPVEERSLA